MMSIQTIKKLFSRVEYPAVIGGKVGDKVVVLTNEYAPVIPKGSVTTIVGVERAGQHTVFEGVPVISRVDGYLIRVTSPKWNKDFLDGLFVLPSDITKEENIHGDV